MDNRLPGSLLYGGLLQLLKALPPSDASWARCWPFITWHAGALHLAARHNTPLMPDMPCMRPVTPACALSLTHMPGMDSWQRMASLLSFICLSIGSGNGVLRV